MTGAAGEDAGDEEAFRTFSRSASGDVADPDDPECVGGKKITPLQAAWNITNAIQVSETILRVSEMGKDARVCSS